MEFKVLEQIDKDEKIFILKIPTSEYIRANFDKFDRLLLEDCQKEDATIADKLLGLEKIARRIEQSVISGISRKNY